MSNLINGDKCDKEIVGDLFSSAKSLRTR